MASHKFILSAGHRNTNRGGANNEINWTPGATRALRDAIVARGGEAFIIQELRGENDFINAGLQTVAQMCVTESKTKGPFDAYLSMHYNGGGSPGFHIIFPSAGTESKATNPVDVELCRKIRDAVRATGTVRMLSWTADSPGVMAEQETGVGAQGYRLGEFVGTLDMRSTTARVILEASSIDVASERAYINDARWVRDVYAEAIVDGLEAQFGKFSDAPVPQPVPVPERIAPSLLPALEQLKNHPDTEIPALVKDGNDWWFFIGRDVQARVDTPRLLYAVADSPRLGPDIKAGETFYVWFGTFADDGYPYGYTRWGTRVRLWDTDLGIRS